MKQYMKATMKTFINEDKLGENEQAKKPQDSSNLTHKDISDTRRAPPLEGGNSQEIIGMWMLKQKIISPNFYKIPPRFELR